MKDQRLFFRCIKTHKMEGTGEVTHKNGYIYEYKIDEDSEFGSCYLVYNSDSMCCDHIMKFGYAKKYFKKIKVFVE